MGKIRDAIVSNIYVYIKNSIMKMRQRKLLKLTFKH